MCVREQRTCRSLSPVQQLFLIAVWNANPTRVLVNYEAEETRTRKQLSIKVVARISSQGKSYETASVIKLCVQEVNGLNLAAFSASPSRFSMS